MLSLMKFGTKRKSCTLILMSKELQETLKSKYTLDTNSYRFYRKSTGKLAGTQNSRGYRQINFNHRLYVEHHLVWLWFTGKLPKELDHINHIRDDNSIHNLREVTRLENQQNQSEYRKNNKFPTGIQYREDIKKFGVFVYKNSKPICLGYFSELGDAIASRAIGKKEYYSVKDAT